MARRRARSEDSLKRKKGRKKGAPRILIVCEGEKTERNYFEAIRKEKHLSAARVQIVPSDYGTDPLNVVDYAEDRFLEEGKAYDFIFAVFDRDDHGHYHDALSRAAALNNRYKNDAGVSVPFKAIPSVPNFELWLLLHFRDVLATIHRTEVYAELRTPARYPTYAKNGTTAYDDTKEHVPAATARAKVLRTRFAAEDGHEPFTEVDILVKKMLDIPPAWV